jgi:hypothetical protein
MRKGNDRFYEIPITHGDVTSNKGEGGPGKWDESRRGIGLAEMAWSIRKNRPHRCNSDIHLHALELIHGLEVCGRDNVIYTMTTKPDRPRPLKAGMIGTNHEAAIAD